MKEIYPKLYIGDARDYEQLVKGQDRWAVVQACKEPYHRQALGYKTKSAPQGHPDYLFTRRDNRLILNLIDADDPKYIPREIIDEALGFTHEQLGFDHNVLIHCNQGASRAPAIGLLYLVKFTNKLPFTNFSDAENAFCLLYPQYKPKEGIRRFIVANWSSYLPNTR